MKDRQHARMRKSYFEIALGFVVFIALIAFLFGGAIHLLTPEAVVEEENPVVDRAMTARIPGKGTFYMEPDLLVYCGKPTAPADWNFFTDDGTIDQNKVIEFSGALTKWSDCATEYAAVIRAYAASTDMLRDVIVEGAANFFLEFSPGMEMGPEMLGEEFTPKDDKDHAGTFVQGRPCEECHEDGFTKE